MQKKKMNLKINWDRHYHEQTKWYYFPLPHKWMLKDEVLSIVFAYSIYGNKQLSY